VKNESLEHLMSDLQTQERLFGKTSEAAVSAWFKLALWHQENGQPDQARVEQEQALKLLPQITEGNPFLQGQMNGFIFKLGDGYVRSQQYDRAQSLYETLTRLNEKQDGGDDSIIQAQDFIRLAQISLATRNQPQVTEYVKKAVDIVTRIGGPNYKNDADKLRSLQNTAAAAEVGRMRAIIDSIADKQNRIDFGPYMADLQQKIKTNWQPAPSRSTKKVTVRFDLHTDGTISNLRIEDSSGLNEADKAALEAVQKSVPFAMLPKDAVEHVSVRFTFARNVVHRARSPWVPVYIPLRTR
jgi:TonB family protein